MFKFDIFLNETRITKRTVIDTNINGKDIEIVMHPFTSSGGDQRISYSVNLKDTFETVMDGQIVYTDKDAYLHFITVEHKFRRQGWATAFFNYMKCEWPKRYNMNFRNSNIFTAAGKMWKNSLKESKFNNVLDFGDTI